MGNNVRSGHTIAMRLVGPSKRPHPLLLAIIATIGAAALVFYLQHQAITTLQSQTRVIVRQLSEQAAQDVVREVRRTLDGPVFDTLAAYGGQVLDVEQILLRRRLVLGVLVTAPRDLEGLRRAFARVAEELDVSVDVERGTGDNRARRGGRSHVTVLGTPLRPGAMAAIAGGLLAIGVVLWLATFVSRRGKPVPSDAIADAERTDPRA